MCLSSKSNSRSGCWTSCYFACLLFSIRILYIVNVVLQIWLLSLFLGTNFLKFGYESVKLFQYGLNQPESEYFPRETLCDFLVREPLRGEQPMQRITVQCVLTVNLFNQVWDSHRPRFAATESSSKILFSSLLANLHVAMDLVRVRLRLQYLFPWALGGASFFVPSTVHFRPFSFGACLSSRDSTFSFPFQTCQMGSGWSCP